MHRSSVVCGIVLSICSAPCLAERQPVLKQIDLPHAYYYREMYIPQLTTGPSSLAWSPDSHRLVYSMAGSLWVQELGTATAVELTAADGYDYQPDWSPDGRAIVFTRYRENAMELWVVDARDGRSRQLTSGGAVNLEPRFSPDGNRLAFVSTAGSGHFHIFVGHFAGGELTNVEQLTPENISSLPRYYYSKVDHEISPVWTRDGKEILFISNRGHIHGTGGLWHVEARPRADGREIHYEETTWKARPDFSPDGKRIIYASYLGRSWHQLWVMPAGGGDVFPISYGDYDNTNPRWSPDGTKVAFISNRGGNTSLWIQPIPGGSQTQLAALRRKYLQPMGGIALHILAPDGKPIAARVFVTGEDGRAYAPNGAWMAADDSINPSERRFEAHYFDSSGASLITLPAGRTHVDVMRGFEYRYEQRLLQVKPDTVAALTVHLHPIQFGGRDTGRWVSGDVHVHMNYAGTYRNTPEHLLEQADAEDVTVIENLIVNKEQRFPDIEYAPPRLDPVSSAQHLLEHAQEFHTSYWGHLGLLGLRSLVLPGYAAYPNTAAESLFPANANVADMAHERGALVGYVHPLESVPDPAKEEITYELPADVALGKVDYIEVVGFADHKSTAEVWYKLLNCGFRLPTAAGTDFMGNYASLRGPMGLNRVYAQVAPGPLKVENWQSAIKKGRTFATNGPLLRFNLGGETAGGELRLETGSKVPFKAALRSLVPLDHLQIVCNGRLARELELAGKRDAADVSGMLEIERSGWCILRAFGDRAEYPILDSYPYATTSPVYIAVSGAPMRNPDDAAYFVSWLDRLISAAQGSSMWNSEEEREAVLSIFSRAREKFQALSH
ncbi:MAG: CehA/McbA family metallohydrolase [Acidobacteria bacterium]|nr:CehA/McbA family metallohydrolase [Acidobacteriota bacterium]